MKKSSLITLNFKDIDKKKIIINLENVGALNSENTSICFFMNLSEEDLILDDISEYPLTIEKGGKQIYCFVIGEGKKIDSSLEHSLSGFKTEVFNGGELPDRIYTSFIGGIDAEVKFYPRFKDLEGILDSIQIKKDIPFFIDKISLINFIETGSILPISCDKNYSMDWELNYKKG